MAWFSLAYELKMSVRRCKAEVTSREFLSWREYFARRWNGLDPNILYLAEILAELRTTRTQKIVPRDRVMLQFQTRQPPELDPDDMTPEEKARRVAIMKAATKVRTSVPKPVPAAKKGPDGHGGGNRKTGR